MKALVRNVIKEEGPLVDAVTGSSLTLPKVVFEVDFQNDDGSLHSSARYAFLPEEITADHLQLFDRQAEVMERDRTDAVGQQRAREDRAVAHKPADDKVAELRRHFQLDLAESVPLGDRRGT